MKKAKFLGKKLLAAALAGTMILGLCSCDEEEYEDDGGDQSQETDESVPDDGNGGTRSADVSTMQMTVDRETGEMSISRPELSGEAMGASGTWTIFVYLCGTDLESGGGAAVCDIGEMCSATESANVKFVVQTGGANQWNY
jgi:hypothetical protein